MRVGAWPARGPRPRDDLARWSTADVPDVPLAPIPPLAQDHPAGRTHVVGGRGVHVRHLAGPENGPQAWYIHGLAGSSTNFTGIMRALAPVAGGRSVDLPGHGRSDPPPGGRYSLTADADLVADLIEASDGPVHLIGNSLGGFTATLLAARRPDLVRTLTLISPAVPDLRMTSDRGADIRLGLLLAPGTTGFAIRQLAAIDPESRARGMGELCFADPGLFTDDDLRAAAAELAWRAPLPWAHASTVGALRSLMAHHLRRGRWSFGAMAARIRVPVLVVWGTRDRLVDVRLSRATAAAFADGRLLVLPAVGHVAQMEVPATVARAIAGLWQRGPDPADQPGTKIIRPRQAGAPSDCGSPAVATSGA